MGFRSFWNSGSYLLSGSSCNYTFSYDMNLLWMLCAAHFTCVTTLSFQPMPQLPFWNHLKYKISLCYFFFQVRGCLWSNFFYHHVFFNNKANWNLSKSKSRNLCMFHKTRTKPLLDNSYRYSRQLCLDKFWNESLVLGPKCCFYAKGGAFGHFGEVTFSH